MRHYFRLMVVHYSTCFPMANYLDIADYIERKLNDAEKLQIVNALKCPKSSFKNFQYPMSTIYGKNRCFSSNEFDKISLF